MFLSVYFTRLSKRFVDFYLLGLDCIKGGNDRLGLQTWFSHGKNKTNETQESLTEFGSFARVESGQQERENRLLEWTKLLSKEIEKPR